MPDYFRPFWRQRDQKSGVAIHVPARQDRRNQFRGAIGINILQGINIELNGFPRAGVATTLLAEFKANGFGSLTRLEGRSTVAAEFLTKLENAAIRIFNRPCVTALLIGQEREFAFDRTRGLAFRACCHRQMSVAHGWKH